VSTRETLRPVFPAFSPDREPPTRGKTFGGHRPVPLSLLGTRWPRKQFDPPAIVVKPPDFPVPLSQVYPLPPYARSCNGYFSPLPEKVELFVGSGLVAKLGCAPLFFH